jgi:RNA-directed DNA polymerase
MTAATAAGATSHRAETWHAIDWRKVYRTVRRLQARIVQAVRAGRWGKVKALQRLLTHSFAAKALAVKRVTSNPGRRTPGVDGVLWSTPATKLQAVSSLRHRGYRARPLRRVYIPKRSGNGHRPLSIPCMQDRAMQALALLGLDPIAETLAAPHSYGFRLARSTADAIGQCFTVLNKRKSPQWILEGDIQSCFDEISHDWLLAHVPMAKALLRQWLRAGFMDKCTLSPTTAGTPQGAICSPVLANLALDDLEGELRRHFPSSKKGDHAQVHVVRYCDDFIITGRSKEVLEQEVKPVVEHFLAGRGLRLSPVKTVITHIAEGFDFLGQNVRKYDGKLLIKPSRRSVKALLERVRAVLKGNRQAPAGQVIGQLNPLLRGWANYHCHVVSKETFAKIDYAIFRALWRWATRRHPHKGRRWVRQRYFTAVRNNQWVFQGLRTDRGTPREDHLVKLAATPIRRHVKVRGEAKVKSLGSCNLG